MNCGFWRNCNAYFLNSVEKFRYFCYNSRSADCQIVGHIDCMRKIWRGGYAAAPKKVTTTKYELVQTASECFMEIGYSNTSPNLIANKLGISIGILAYLRCQHCYTLRYNKKLRKTVI